MLGATSGHGPNSQCSKKFQNPQFCYARIIDVECRGNETEVHVVVAAGVVTARVTRFISTDVLISTEDYIAVTAYDPYGDVHIYSVRIIGGDGYDPYGDVHIYSVTASLCPRGAVTDDRLDHPAIEIIDPYTVLPKPVWIVVLRHPEVVYSTRGIFYGRYIPTALQLLFVESLVWGV